MKIIRIITLGVLAGFLSPSSLAAYFGPYVLLAPTAVDGDTIKADVPVWPGVNIDASIRVIGVDTPEMTPAGCATPAENAAIRAAAVRAKEFTEAWINRNSPVVIGNVKPDAYSGRYDAVVTGSGGERLAAALIQAGHGRLYNGGKRQTWCAP